MFLGVSGDAFEKHVNLINLLRALGAIQFFKALLLLLWRKKTLLCDFKNKIWYFLLVYDILIILKIERLV